MDDFAQESPVAMLRQALAITRLMAYQKKGIKKFDVTNLHGLFEEIHRVAYQDEQQNSLLPHSPGQVRDQKKKNTLRTYLKSIADSNREEALFDANKFAIYHENIAERLADLYRKIQTLKPFDYGNELTLDFFMQSLSSLKSFARNYGEIDFTRLSEEDAHHLHTADPDPAKDKENLITAFKHALDPTLSMHLNNTKENTKEAGYPSWKMKDVEIREWKFLSVEPGDKNVIFNPGVNPESIGTCLVRMDGSLVPLSAVKGDLEKLIDSTKQFADFPRLGDNKVVGHLEGTTALKNKEHIDGFDVTNSMPFFCLDAHILTGLTPARHAAFMHLLESYPSNGKPPKPTDLNDSGPDKTGTILKNRLTEAAKGNPSLQRSVEIAYEHINRITKKLDLLKLTKFEGIEPVDNKGTPLQADGVFRRVQVDGFHITSGIVYLGS